VPRIPYQIQSSDHGAQVDSQHDSDKLDWCSVLDAIVSAAQRIFTFDFLVVSHGCKVWLSVLLCAVHDRVILLEVLSSAVVALLVLLALLTDRVQPI
jgi:hypothetical protein